MPLMTKDELYNLHFGLCQQSFGLMYTKNQDYAGYDADAATPEVDVFANFRTHGELGILVRLFDKLHRWNSWVKKRTFAVVSEGLLDVGLDIINYAVLFLGFLHEKGVIDLGYIMERGQWSPKIDGIALGAMPAHLIDPKKRSTSSKLLHQERCYTDA